MTTPTKLKVVAEATNGAEAAIAASLPYTVQLTIEGASDMLFHRWNCEEVESKAAAAKNSTAKKTDNIESYVWRCDDGSLGVPGEYLRQSIIHAAKFRQDPRSPRKSAMDLYKAGIVSLTAVASLGVETWDYEDKRRAVIQRNAINRIRPAMLTGWRASFHLMVNTPEYIAAVDLRSVIDTAGRLVGVGDFRPTFGRFHVTKWEVLQG